MSAVRKTFWHVVARGYGGSSPPRKYGTNWFMPALVRSSPGTGEIKDEDGTSRWPRSPQKSRNRRRISFESMVRPSVPTDLGGSAHQIAGDQVPQLGLQPKRL